MASHPSTSTICGLDGIRLNYVESLKSEQRCRRTQKSDDRLAWVEHEQKRHSVYRQSAFWSLPTSDGGKEPTEQTLAQPYDVNGFRKLCETDIDVSICTTVVGFLLSETVATLRRLTEWKCSSVLSRVVCRCLRWVRDVFSHRHAKAIIEAPSKLCSLDPMPTNVFKDFLPETIVKRQMPTLQMLRTTDRSPTSLLYPRLWKG